MGNKYFIKFIEHSSEFYELIKRRHTAYVLLSILVDRTRKIELNLKDGISVGEAQTGARDADLYGVGRQVYRSDLEFLQRIGLISTSKVTNLGTIVKLVNSSMFDISRNELTSKVSTSQPTTIQPPTIKQEVRDKKKKAKLSQATEKNAFFQNRPTGTLLNEASQSLNEDEDVQSTYKSNDTSDGEKKELYWYINAPRLAGEMNISEESWQYENAKKDWLRRAKILTPNSIKEFLNSANDWDEKKIFNKY